MCSISEDVQYDQGTSSIQAGMCSTNQAHHQSTSEDVQHKQVDRQIWYRGKLLLKTTFQFWQKINEELFRVSYLINPANILETLLKKVLLCDLVTAFALY